jgi:UDP-N-acetylglucosamine 3-dehydrogenase
MKIKVAIIGCGSITEFRHAPEYRANENVEIAAFCDPLAERAEKLANKFGCRAFTDYRDVLNITDLDAVSVCTANSTHASITLDALKAGKHVLCEKPMAVNFDDAKQMIETAKLCKRFLMIGHNQRLEKVHIRAKEILKCGEMGRVLSFRTTFGHGGPEMWSADKGIHTWFFKKNAASIGAMGDLGIHKADLIRWLIDDEIDEVCAMLSTRDKRNELGNLIEIEDNAICILKSRSGIIGNMDSSWTYYGEMDNGTILYCQNGIVRIFANPDYNIIIEKKNGEKVLYKLDSNTNSGIIDAFVRSVVSGVKPEISGEEGCEALNIILACQESFEKKSFAKVRHLM